MVFKQFVAQKKSTVSEVVSKKERRKVSVQNFKAISEPNVIEIDGRLNAHERVAITSKVQGIMETGTNIKVGQYIKKGDLMYAIDNLQASYNLKALRASLLTAITQLMPDIKFDYPFAFEKWEKYLNDFDVEKRIKPLPEPSNDQEKYFIASRNLQNQYYQIKSQETQLGDYFIYAPFSGVVTETNVFSGALISPGQSLCTMINTGLYEMSAPIALEDLKYVKVGQKVKLSSSEMAKSWTGRVSRIGTQIDDATQNIPLFIAVNGSGLKDGMYLRGELKGNLLKDVIKLPKRIFLSPNSIYTIEDSTLIDTKIETIKRGSDFVLVKGIPENTKIVVGSLVGLFPGQKVTY
jgi:multidrug efflux pump subunit AcrA (membrane-fusion protein)